jgi:phosphatidylglycerol:prolipoprotein diacylglycerol transferase
MHVPGFFNSPPLPTIPLGYFVININPILVQIGTLAIHWYGVMYVVAIAIGVFALRRWCPKMGIHEDQLYGLFIWAAIGGLIGGRLYFVIQQPELVDRYLKQPANILAVWNGGMAFFGAIFLGTATLFILAPRYGLDRWLAIDGGAVFALVGQIFGRVGNIINGDILGQQASAGLVNVPGSTCASAPCIAYVSDPSVQPAWSFVYLHPGSFAPPGVAFQPAPIYEMLINIALLLLLFPLRYYLPRVKAGYFFIAYLALYAMGQFFVFFWRGTEPFTPILGIHVQLKQAQWTALVVLVLCIPLFLLVRRVSAPWPYSAKKPVPWPPVSASAVKKPAADGAQSEAIELPPWQPTHAIGGALRNIFAPPRPRDDAGTEW